MGEALGLGEHFWNTGERERKEPCNVAAVAVAKSHTHRRAKHSTAKHSRAQHSQTTDRMFRLKVTGLTGGPQGREGKDSPACPTWSKHIFS